MRLLSPELVDGWGWGCSFVSSFLWKTKGFKQWMSSMRWGYTTLVNNNPTRRMNKYVVLSYRVSALFLTQDCGAFFVQKLGHQRWWERSCCIPARLIGSGSRPGGGWRRWTCCRPASVPSHRLVGGRGVWPQTTRVKSHRNTLTEKSRSYIWDIPKCNNIFFLNEWKHENKNDTWSLSYLLCE